MPTWLPWALFGVASGLVGLLVSTKGNVSGKTARIIEDAEKKANRIVKTAKLDAKHEIQEMKLEAQQDVNMKKQEAAEIENKITIKEQKIDAKMDQLDLEKEKTQKVRENLKTLETKMSNQLDARIKELERVSGLSTSEAKKEMMSALEEQMAHEMSVFIKEREEEAEEKAEAYATNLISLAVERYSREVIGEITTSTISLPSDDLKGRLIGREGRNIRAIEAMTGVDVIIDDTPEAITISCFNPIRRQVAKRAIEQLIKDGRIQPGRIEEVVEKAQSEIDKIIMEKGNQAVFDMQIGKIHKDLVKYIGVLHFRTSYGQNALLHSMEVAEFAGAMAAELGQDQRLAKRAGILHDIGKALDIEQEGSHVELGAALCRKYGEHEVVINGIECHHGDKPATSVIANLITAADALSASRPGARSNSVENYIQRIAELEKVASAFDGVAQAYAIKAGREIRVMVEPGAVNDLQAAKLARDIRDKVESDLTYPGTVKINVIREVRSEAEAM